ncbi:MAG: hypothetical protein P8Y09_11310 [Deltaproteobacteria bacterium]|jgi:hypothetical protein
MGPLTHLPTLATDARKARLQGGQLYMGINDLLMTAKMENL